MRSNIIDAEAVYAAKTERAIGVAKEEGGKELAWFPLSQVEISGECIYGQVITLTGPEQLFIDKGLV